MKKATCPDGQVAFFARCYNGDMASSAPHSVSGATVQPRRSISLFAPLGRTSHRWGLFLLFLGLLFTCFAPRFDSETVRWAGKFFSDTFHTVWLVGGILILVWQSWRGKSKALFLQALAAFGTETAFVQISQKGLYKGFGLLPRPSGTDGGFPSGHTAAHCVLAYLLTERFPKFGPLFYAAAALVSWSRWQDGAHFPYQVVAGAVVGLACAVLLAPHFGEVQASPATAKQEDDHKRV
jgi:undecaprenyl-diphosphatase